MALLLLVAIIPPPVVHFAAMGWPGGWASASSFMRSCARCVVCVVRGGREGIVKNGSVGKDGRGGEVTFWSLSEFTGREWRGGEGHAASSCCL